MVVGICAIEIVLPHAQSLKDKRRVLKGLKDRLRSRHNISLAEVGGQDLWQRATLGMAAVADTRTPLEELFNRIHREIQESIPGDIVDARIDYV
jgi:uncharacterized protein YlxP (DUF503 family)